MISLRRQNNDGGSLETNKRRPQKTALKLSAVKINIRKRKESFQRTSERTSERTSKRTSIIEWKQGIGGKRFCSNYFWIFTEYLLSICRKMQEEKFLLRTKKLKGSGDHFLDHLNKTKTQCVCYGNALRERQWIMFVENCRRPLKIVEHTKNRHKRKYKYSVLGRERLCRYYQLR